jgi:type III secretion protein U
VAEQSTSQRKTEPPTEKRLRDARRKGDVPISNDFPSAMVLLIFAVFLSWGAVGLTQGLHNLFDQVLTADFRTLAQPRALHAWLAELLRQGALLLAVPLAALWVTSVLSSALQTGGVFSVDPVKPQLSRVNPVEGVKRLFSVHSAVELAKLGLKALLLAVIVWVVALRALPDLLRSHWLSLTSLLPLAGEVLLGLIWPAVMAFVAIAAFDLWFQRWNHRRLNRMTREEVRREQRETEGDPQLRGKRRELHRELSINNMLENMRKASVVVVNPTHVAVALYYEAGRTDLPVVLAKGEDDVARAIRGVAERERIPVLQNVDLARRLAEQAPLNDFIPDEFIEPVAEVLRWVRSLKAESETPLGR